MFSRSRWLTYVFHLTVLAFYWHSRILLNPAINHNFLFITYWATQLRYQRFRPSAPSGADMFACVPLSLSLLRVTNWSVSCWIGNNNRNCKLRIHPDCQIGIWHNIYTVWKYVISSVIQPCVFTYRKFILYMCKILFWKHVS